MIRLMRARFAQAIGSVWLAVAAVALPCGAASPDSPYRVEGARRVVAFADVLLGNHEVMNIVGDLRYVSAGEYAAFAGREDDALLKRRDRLLDEHGARDGSTAAAADASIVR
jgi:hypothetical protein